MGALVCAVALTWPAAVSAELPSHAIPVTPLSIIQGRDASSPLIGQTVHTVGRVTGITATGFFLQDPLGDGDPLSSDGLFVYTRARPQLAPGSCVYVEAAQVVEFYARTELTRPQRVAASDACPPDPVTPVVVTWQQPGFPASAHWEALEGMLVRLHPAAGVVHGPTRRFAGGEVELALLDARLTHLRAPGHIFHHETAQSVPAGEALLFLSNRLGATLPAANWGDRLHGDDDGWLGVIDYHFGKYQFIPLPGQVVTVTRGLAEPGLPEPPAADEYTLCTFNVYGLGRSTAQYTEADAYNIALRNRAAAIAESLHGCTVVALQETGTPDDAAALAATLRAEFGLDYRAAALPGPASAHPEFPLTNSLLVRNEQVTILALTQVQACTPQDYGLVVPGVCGAGRYPVFERPPLAAQLEVRGPWPSPQVLWLVNNHWKSKAGDERVNARLRAAQATAVADFVSAQAAQEPEAQIVVLGDLNDFYDGPALALVQDAVAPPLVPLLALVPQADRYTYLFNGTAQALDHVLVTENLARQTAAVHVVHINADFAAPDQSLPGNPASLRSSDHDPILVRIRPGGATVLGGMLGAAGVAVSAQDVLGRVVATAVSDARGEYRLWGLTPGPLALRFTAPDGAILEPVALSLTAAPGFHLTRTPVVTYTAPIAALWLALLTPDLADWPPAPAR